MYLTKRFVCSNSGNFRASLGAKLKYNSIMSFRRSFENIECFWRHTILMLPELSTIEEQTDWFLVSWEADVCLTDKHVLPMLPRDTNCLLPLQIIVTPDWSPLSPASHGSNNNGSTTLSEETNMSKCSYDREMTWIWIFTLAFCVCRNIL